MASRLELQTLLESVLGSDSVYFKPPPSIKMSYPCIVYNRSRIQTNYANNSPYYLKKRYMLTVIDRDPDSLIPDKVSMLDTASFDRQYTDNGLIHDVFTIYF